MEPNSDMRHWQQPPRLPSASAPDLAGISWINLRELFGSGGERGTQVLHDYYARLAQAFPIAEERPTIERLQQRLQDPTSPLQIVCALQGKDIVGARQFKIFNRGIAGTFAAGEFLFVAPEHRKLRIGSAVVAFSEKMMIANGATFVIGEFHDPYLCSEQDRASDAQAGMTPESRLQFWEKRGYQQFDAPYWCAPVFGSTEWIRNLTLGLRQLGAAQTLFCISTPHYLDIVTRYWDSFSSGYKSTPEYREFALQLAKIPEVRIVPLLSRRSFLPT